MASPAQINANLINAQSSTGPTSAEGKSKSSRNAVQLGLFSKRDFVPEDNRDAYAELREELLTQLNPDSILEEVLTHEIISAAWRLERCAQIEANFDAAQNEADPVARARASASRVLWKSMNELRKLQNDRCTRRELSEDYGDGLATLADMYKGMESRSNYSVKQAQALISQCQAEYANLGPVPLPKLQNKPDPTPAATPVDIQTARNAPCPCGSADKYKRCCGSSAPPKLSMAACGSVSSAPPALSNAA